MSATKSEAAPVEFASFGPGGSQLVRLPSVKPLKLRRRRLSAAEIVSDQCAVGESHVARTINHALTRAPPASPPKFCYPQKRWPSSVPRSPSTISQDASIRTFARNRSESALKLGCGTQDKDSVALSPSGSSGLGHVGLHFINGLPDPDANSSSDHDHAPYIPILLDTRSTSLPIPDAQRKPRPALASEPKVRHAASRSISDNRVDLQPAQDRYPVLGGTRASMPVTPSETQARQHLLGSTIRSDVSLDMARSDTSDEVQTPPMTPSKAGCKALQVLGRSEERGGRKPAKWELAKASVERRVRAKPATAPPEEAMEKLELATILAERFAKLSRSRRKPVPVLEAQETADIVVIRPPDASDSEEDVFGSKFVAIPSSSKAPASLKRRIAHRQPQERAGDVSCATSDSDRPGRTSPKPRPPPLTLPSNTRSAHAQVRVIQCDTSVTKTPVTPAKKPFVPYAAPRTAPSPPRRMAQQPVKPTVVRSIARKSTVPAEIETQAWTKGQSFFLDESPTAPTFLSSVTKTLAAKGDRLKRQASQTIEAAGRP